MDCAVEITIRAIADVLWSLLLKARTDGSTDFAMTERFSGLMLPLIKASLPDFGPVFERYAKDLKQAAEAVTPRSP